MSHCEFQRLIDGDVEAITRKSVMKLLSETTGDENTENADRVRQAVMRHPETQRFILFAIPKAQTQEESHEEFARWLYSIPSFEAWARTARQWSAGCDFNDSESGVIPEWYTAYLQTDYWTRKRAEAIDVYKGCVLCSSVDGKIDTHHRTYRTLGRERMWDLSCLCSRCHNEVHQFLTVCFPSECPEAVLRILEREQPRVG